jgi:tetratricopeptide (TPR) repeat protein
LLASEAARSTLAAVASDRVSHGLATEIALARVSAHARLGDADAAEAAIADARTFAFETGNRSLELDVLVHEAALRLMQGATGETARIVDEVFRLREAPAPAFSGPYRTLWDVPHVVARALELHAFAAGTRSDIATQTSSLRDAFRAARDSSTRDQWLVANLAANCALVVRESGRLDVLDELRAWSEDVAWPDELGIQRYHLESSFGLAFALSNDRLKAFKAYRRAAEIAPSPSWRIVAMLDRIVLARAVREDHALALDELDAAREAATRIDWSLVSGESYVALLFLAQACAAVDPDAASAYLDRYRRSHAAATQSLAGRFDPRRVAHETFASGLIAAGRGRTAEAVDAFDRAHAAFRAASCTWRAALVAVERYAVLPDATSRALADASVAAFRESWLATRYATLKADSRT